MQALDAQRISNIIEGLAAQILNDSAVEQHSLEKVVLVGIIRRGRVLARRLADSIAAKTGKNLPVGELDITMYRDDLAVRTSIVIPQVTRMNFRVDEKVVILCDDVLDAGRSIRAALDALVDFGRPRVIRVVTLVDRGRREFPIAADYIGIRIPEEDDTRRVFVQLTPEDPEDKVFVG